MQQRFGVFFQACLGMLVSRLCPPPWQGPPASRLRVAVSLHPSPCETLQCRSTSSALVGKHPTTALKTYLETETLRLCCGAIRRPYYHCCCNDPAQAEVSAEWCSCTSSQQCLVLDCTQHLQRLCCCMNGQMLMLDEWPWSDAERTLPVLTCLCRAASARKSRKMQTLSGL